MNFPAKRLETRMDWADLALPKAEKEEIRQIATWIDHSERLLGNAKLGHLISSGYRALFFGPPGTGKALAATLLGKHVGRDVYRVDLSMVINKYIGETEKNLNRVFDAAAGNGWILFFDEADALFAARSGATGAHDRYANQKVGYLLQRIEDFDGVVILASNLRSNIDAAFVRRFQSVVQFSEPDAYARLQMWQQMTRGADWLAPEVDLGTMAEAYALNGAGIANVLQRAVLGAAQDGRNLLTPDDIGAAIEREMRKNTAV